MVTSSVAPQQAQAAAQAKAGAKCSAKNSTQISGNRKFTCIKSRNGLVWNQGVLLAKPKSPASTTTIASTPRPSAAQAPTAEAIPNPFDSNPFPNEFTRADMVNAMFKSFDDFIRRPQKVNSYKIIIDTLFQGDSAAITKIVKDVYSVLPFPTGYPTTVVILSDDKDFIEKYVKENGFGKEGFQETGYHCKNCSGYGWATSSNPLSSVTPHEMFHVWQKAATKRDTDNNPDPNNPLNSPIWFDEGGADFFAEAMYSKISGNYQAPKVRWEPFHLIDYATRDKDRYLPYSLGRLASEYIVASRGVDKYLSIYSNMGNGQDFPSAFESAIGITLGNFYDKFDKNLQKML